MKNFLFFISLFWISLITGQTTDLSISLEAQDLSGNAISQAHIYGRYNYLITLSNTGNAVSNADFNLNISSVHEIESYTVQNILGGAATPTGVTINNNDISGVLPSMPNSSSLEILVTLRADVVFLGGATATANVNPPTGTNDTNTSTNSSIISIIMTDRAIDFQINQSQIIPTGNGNLAAWGDSVTYEMTITNNSTIEYPLQDFSIIAQNVNMAGTALVTIENLDCISGNGMNCPTLGVVSSTNAENITNVFNFYTHSQETVFPVGASITLKVTYKIEEGDCSRLNPNTELVFGNRVSLTSYHSNISPLSDLITTTTLLNVACPCTDLEANVVKVSPVGNALSAWTDIVTFDYTFTNNGPLDIESAAYLINTSNLGTGIEILSATCISTTGTINCSDINITITPDYRWITDVFIFPTNSSVTIRTTVRFIPPDCTDNGIAPICSVRGIVYEDDINLVDCDNTNDFSGDSIAGLPVTPCDVVGPGGAIIQVTDTQTIPTPGAGPYPYGNISYEIVLSNVDTVDHLIRFRDLQGSTGTGTLQSIVCTGTTGGATCPTNLNANIGVANSLGDTFWEILETDGVVMPAGSTITFEKTIDWLPECSTTSVSVADDLLIEAIDTSFMSLDSDAANVSTPMVPCVDIVVQTYPSVTSSPINTVLEWIVDITNSNISVDASNITFNDILHPDFTITGTPTCTVISGNATCISSFMVTGNQIDATIPFMESGATIQVRIPVESPSYGGSFENRAEAQPDFTQQGENTPSSNISISSLFVLTTQTSKSFEPSIINTGETSILTFTLTNSVGLPAQSGIAFIDNLSPEITLSGNAYWVNQNGASGTFIDTIGSSSIGIQNLSFPAGTDEISFAVEVTSNQAGFYTNDFQNFSNLNNIDISTAFATLQVLPILDLEITKIVDNARPQEDDFVTFTIQVQNLGTTTATDVVVNEQLPDGYSYESHSASTGFYDTSTGLWSIGDMMPGDVVTLTITVSLNIPGDFINIVTVSSSNALADINLENNIAQALARPQCLEVVEGFSPNNDGMNDTFEIQCIELYPDNELKIFNRYGSVIYSTTGYLNDWDAIPNDGLLHNSGARVPVGTYFWQLDLNDGTEPRVGWVYINY